MAEHAGKVEHAAQAADHARRALPIAERALANASAEVVRLRERKSQQISSIKIEHGDVLARRYDAKRRELSEIHDQVIGFARGCNLPNIVLTTKPYEVPRFDLPATPSGDVYTRFIPHVPDNHAVGAAAAMWSRFSADLTGDPYAEVSAVSSSDPIGEVGGEQERTKSIMITRRPREELAGGVDAILLEQHEIKERRHVRLA